MIVVFAESFSVINKYECMSWVRAIYYEKPMKYLSVRNCLGREFIHTILTVLDF